MIEKVKCKSALCKAMILPSTAESTGGFCMPCKQKAEQAEREEYIRKNRRDVDPFAGVTDPVEIIKIRHQARPPDPLIRYLPPAAPPAELYAQLTDAEVSRLIRHVVENLAPGTREGVFSIAEELAAFTQADLAELHTALLSVEEYYPGYLFRGAAPEIARDLIRRLGDDAAAEHDQVDVNHILQALAWAGTEDVVSQFAQWRTRPPKWRSKLYIPPEAYAHCAGWELDASNMKRTLVLHECYPLIAPGDTVGVGPVSTCVDLGGACEWCGNSLTALFSFDLSDEHLRFIPFQGRQLTIASCQVCSAFSDQLYMRAGPNGEARWHDGSQMPDWLPKDSRTFERLPANALRLSLKPRLLHHAVDWCLPTACSQVGGLPSWINDTAYDRCPECRKGFVFVAQLAVEDVDAWGEGIFYALMCPDCSITTVRYQQT